MQSIKDVIPDVLKIFERAESSDRNRLWNQWPTIAGPKIAPHTKPSLGQNGQLFIWVDQSTLAFELNQRYGPSLLKRAQVALGEKKVKSIRFLVGQLR